MFRLISLMIVLLGSAACANPVTPTTVATVARFGLALDGRPITTARLDGLAVSHGARPGVVVIFEQWPEKPASSDLVGLAESLAAIRTAGATPVITWEPMYYRADGTEVILSSSEILDGSYDAYLDAFAGMLVAHRGPVIVRLMHEPNLGRYHWGVIKDTYDERAPEVYQQLWRHIVTRVRTTSGPIAAKAIRFAFCPNAESVPGPGNSATANWNTITGYYPGAEWVDVVGVDGYNWGDTQTPAKNGWQSNWRTFADILGPAVKELRMLAPAKPLYVFETATAPTGGDKAAWLRDTVTTARGWGIEAVCWFEADKEIDWRLATRITPADVTGFVQALGAP